MAKLRVEVEVRPTEDKEKVLQALGNIIDVSKAVVREEDRGKIKIIVAEARSLEPLAKLHDALRRERILDAARKMLKKGLRGNLLMFKLNKQAAYMNRVSFVDSDAESPLGAITVIVEHDNPREVIDWLAPKTSMGRPLWERGMPS